MQYGVNILSRDGEICVCVIIVLSVLHVRLLICYQRTVDRFNKKISHVFLKQRERILNSQMHRLHLT